MASDKSTAEEPQDSEDSTVETLHEPPFECPECSTELIPFGRYQRCPDCNENYKKEPVKFRLRPVSSGDENAE